MSKESKQSNGHISRAPKRYGSYLFRTKDPVIDEIRTIVQDEYGKVDYKALRTIEEHGGPTAACLIGWFYGKTKRPNNATVEAAGRAMGRKRVWVSHRPNN
jgi:hypothetical protein